MTAEATLDEIAMLAASALERLPAPFRALAGDLLIRVEEEADAEVLDELGIDDPRDLLGLYQGTDHGHKTSEDFPIGPDMVFLYRLAIADFMADTDDDLETIVTHVLVHEIGHHFGLSDEDMEAIEADMRDGE